MSSIEIAGLTITSINTGSETVKWAWRRIQSILEAWSDDAQHLGQGADTDTFDQLDRSLRGDRVVISALEEDLQPFTKTLPPSGSGPAVKRGFMDRSKIIWNEGMLRDHQERIRDQVNSMNLLISVLKM